MEMHVEAGGRECWEAMGRYPPHPASTRPAVARWGRDLALDSSYFQVNAPHFQTSLLEAAQPLWHGAYSLSSSTPR